MKVTRFYGQFVASKEALCSTVPTALALFALEFGPPALQLFMAIENANHALQK